MIPLLPPPKWIAFALAILLLLAAAILAALERNNPDFHQCPLCDEPTSICGK